MNHVLTGETADALRNWVRCGACEAWVPEDEAMTEECEGPTRRETRPPSLTIEQVVRACEALYGTSPKAPVRVYGVRLEEDGDRFRVELSGIHAYGATPENALQQLGHEAVAKLKERHALDAAALRELGQVA